jgi:hypothetical protein
MNVVFQVIFEKDVLGTSARDFVIALRNNKQINCHLGGWLD